MSRRRFFLRSVLAVVVFLALTGVGEAQWDFFTGVQHAWMYGYYGQLGNNGFFGPENFDASSTGNFAPINGWVGNDLNDTNELVAGTNAASSNLTAQVTPKIRADWARFSGRYMIQAYDTATTSGSYVAMSPGQLTMWAISAETPMALFSWGKREFRYGHGLQFSHNRSQEYFLVEKDTQVPNLLGRMVAAGLFPARLLSWFNPQSWPRYKKRATPITAFGNPKYQEPEDELFGVPTADGQGRQSLFKQEGFIPGEPTEGWPTDDDAYAWGHFGPGRLRFGLGFMTWQELPSAYVSLWNSNDLNSGITGNVIAFARYFSSDLTFGVGGIYSKFSAGPELQRNALYRTQTPPVDDVVTEGWIYLQFNNGRLFLNLETDWYNEILRFQRSQTGVIHNGPRPLVPPQVPNPPTPEFFADGSGRSIFAPQYTESWRYMVETGYHFGTASLRFFYSFLPGPDRRHGILINHQPFVNQIEQAAVGFYDPYSILLAAKFGGGANYNQELSDASAFAVKAEYALAANLITQFSVLHARRNSDGYGWGYIRPDTNPTRFGRVDYAIRGTFLSASPAIPEKSLGWEFLGGAIWELLEGYALEARLAYWMPGKWFNYACIDKSVPLWDTPSAANNWGVRPDRTIDPVCAFELRFSAAY